MMTLLLAMQEEGPWARMLQTRFQAVRDKDAFWQSVEQQSYEWIVLHVELFADAYPWEWVMPLRQLQPGAKVIVLSSEAVYDSLWQEVLHRLAAEAGFTVSPVGLGIGEAAQFAWRELAGRQEHEPASGRVAAVWSAACKDGATTVAAGTAAALARETPLKIGLLDLNFKNPELRIQLNLPDAGKRYVPLRSKLQMGTLRSSELIDAMSPYRKNPNLQVLPGTFRRDTAADWSPEMIASLLAVCRDTFDVTIVDVSSYPDNAATVCAVRSADERWYVARNHRSSYMWNWSEWYECCWRQCGVEPEQIGMVLNRFDPAGEKAEKAAASIGMKLAGVLPTVSLEAVRRATDENRLLSELSEEMDAGVRQLAEKLVGRPLAEKSAQRRRTWLPALPALWKGGERSSGDFVNEAEGAL